MPNVAFKSWQNYQIYHCNIFIFSFFQCSELVVWQLKSLWKLILITFCVLWINNNNTSKTPSKKYKIILKLSFFEGTKRQVQYKPYMHPLLLKGKFTQKLKFCHCFLTLKVILNLYEFNFTQNKIFGRMWVTKQV